MAISFQQIIGDCNPGHPTHWLLERAASGKLTHLVSQHEDNPRYFLPDGTPTREGVDYIERLDSLVQIEEAVFAVQAVLVVAANDEHCRVIRTKLAGARCNPAPAYRNCKITCAF